MYDNSEFQQLIDNGNPTGEVVSVDGFLVTVKGLDGIAIGSVVMFESGQKGIVQSIDVEDVLILNLESEDTQLGTVAALKSNELLTPVGSDFIGRVITPLCHPLDNKGPLRFESTWPIHKEAPSLMERSILTDQISSGVAVVDVLFPIVLGQRIAILGDAKSGKTSFCLQLGINQINTDRIVIYVLIGKRKVEVDQLIRSLNDTGAIKNSIVIVADMFESLTQSYLAPYIGCSIAEYFWQNERDVVIVYDDLSAHAKIYREVSLLAGSNPGRDSYPGDMFFAHSSLLERAGKLASNGKTLTALPVITTPGDDITAYLPTNIMSIVDGQIVFDLETFRKNIRPAVNTGLSVSRVGGRAQSSRQKDQAGIIFKKISQYRQALELSHFGSDLTAETKVSLDFGKMINDIFHQSPDELFSLNEQQLMIATLLVSAGKKKINTPLLKNRVKAMAANIKTDEDFDKLAQQLLQEIKIESNKQ